MSEMQEPPKVTPQELSKVTPKDAPKTTSQNHPVVTPQSLVTHDLVLGTLKADKGPDAEMLSFEVKDFTKKGDNYACVVTSAIVRYRQGITEGEVTYVAKCNPCRNVEALNEFSAFLFEKEAHFYDIIVPLINEELKANGQRPLRMADCYLTYLGKNKEIIMLQDLRADDFKLYDRKKGMDVAHATLVLREMARLHAASILVQAKMTEPLEKKYTFLQKDFVIVSENPNKEGERMEEMMKTMMYNNVKTGIAMAQRIGGYDKVIDWLKCQSHNVCEVLKTCLQRTPAFDVLCHGDFWINNMLFKYDENGVPVDVRLIDLQICRKASPATDLNYLFYSSFNGPERKNNLDAFLKTYYESFCQVLSDASYVIPFTLDELKKEYHNKNVFGFFMCLMVVPFVVAEGNEILEFDEMTGDMEEDMKMFHEKMLNQLGTNPILRPRLLDTFDEMVEYGVIS